MRGRTTTIVALGGSLLVGGFASAQSPVIRTLGSVFRPRLEKHPAPPPPFVPESKPKPARPAEAHDTEASIPAPGVSAPRRNETSHRGQPLASRSAGASPFRAGEADPSVNGPRPTPSSPGSRPAVPPAQPPAGLGSRFPMVIPSQPPPSASASETPRAPSELPPDARPPRGGQSASLLGAPPSPSAPGSGASARHREAPPAPPPGVVPPEVTDGAPPALPPSLMMPPSGSGVVMETVPLEGPENDFIWPSVTPPRDRPNATPLKNPRLPSASGVDVTDEGEVEVGPEDAEETRRAPESPYRERSGLLDRLFGNRQPIPDPSEIRLAAPEDPNDPIAAANLKRRLERQILRSEGDRIETLEVLVTGQRIHVRARSRRFWQKRALREALATMPMPIGYQATVEVR